MSEQETDVDGCPLIADDECRRLIDWVDTLEIQELQALKKYWDEFIRPKQ